MLIALPPDLPFQRTRKAVQCDHLLRLEAVAVEKATPYFIFLGFTLYYFVSLYPTLPDFTFFAYLSRMSYADHAGVPEEWLGGLS